MFSKEKSFSSSISIGTFSLRKIVLEFILELKAILILVKVSAG
jgi:hypothetical protein